MKQQLLLFAFILFGISSTAFAQVHLDGFPDFTHDDLSGDEQHFYGYLNEGKITVVAFFSMWEASCQAHAPTLEEIYNTHGPNGTNTTMVLGLESVAETADVALAEWPASYPLINTIKGCSDKPHCGLPRYYVVCPDGEWFFLSLELTSEELIAQINSAITNCNAFFENDASVLSVEKTGSVACDAMVNPSFTLYNRGSQNLTSVEVTASIEGEVVSSFNWTGNLAEFETEEVALPSFEAPSDLGVYYIDIAVANPNGVVDQQWANDSKQADILVIPTDKRVDFTLQVTPDFYPDEVSWEVEDANGVKLGEGEGYSGPFSETLCAARGECYTLKIMDTYDDGFASGGGAVLHNGIEIFSFTSDDHNSGMSTFEICFEEQDPEGSNPLGIEDNVQKNGLAVYPNPTRGQLNVVFDANPNESVELRVVSLIGQTLLSETYYTSDRQIPLNLENLADGIYFVVAKTADRTITHKFNLSR